MVHSPEPDGSGLTAVMIVHDNVETVVVVGVTGRLAGGYVGAEEEAEEEIFLHKKGGILR